MTPRSREKLVERLIAMDRPGLIGVLRGLRCDFPIDFSDEFLLTVSLERLRHIVVAASLHASNAEAASNGRVA